MIFREWQIKTPRLIQAGRLGSHPDLGDPWGEEKTRADFEETYIL